ncbi:asparaginase [Ruminococcaceae bacterium OttesenSCG-928-A16]|nr:asparaginase [Ruminococcaceae bacterium OttesenSCG-928-A16]
MPQKQILFLTTGGTIASIAGEDGLTPAAGPDITLAISREFGCKVEPKELFRLDSSNIQPEEWQLLAAEINEAHKKFDGIVVTHGTDTLAYTAAMLSYMLQGVPVPVVLTGSQLPMGHPLTDAPENLHTAFAMALSGRGGVYVAFARKIMLGTRAVKARTRSFNAFESINLPPIAKEDARGLVFSQPAAQPRPYHYRPSMGGPVFLLKVVPGTAPSIIPALAGLGYKGLVIEAFGAGGLHVLRRNLVEELRKITQNGISVVVVSQCLYEPSDFTLYEVGRQALSAGVIEGRDMTSEAAVTKLMWALGNTTTPEEVRKMFAVSLAGEITVEN